MRRGDTSPPPINDVGRCSSSSRLAITPTTSAKTLSDTQPAAPAITPQIRPSTPCPTPPALHGAHVRQSRPVSPPPRRPPASAMPRRQSPPSHLHPRYRTHHRGSVEEARSTLTRRHQPLLREGEH